MFEGLEGRVLLAAAAPSAAALAELSGAAFAGLAGKKAVVMGFTGIGTDGQVTGGLVTGKNGRGENAIFTGVLRGSRLRLAVRDTTGDGGRFTGKLNSDGDLVGRFTGEPGFVLAGGKRGFRPAKLGPTNGFEGTPPAGSIGSIAGGTLGRVTVPLTAGGIELTANNLPLGGLTGQDVLDAIGTTPSLGNIGTTTGAIGNPNSGAGSLELAPGQFLG
jgi:hypothetical protein